MANNQRPLPPIIEAWITALNDRNKDIWIRDNNREMLEIVRDRCSEALTKFNIEKYSAQPAKQRKRG
jgi:hypothetical protein